MKKYEVCVVSKEYRTVTVEAENEEKAEQKVWEILTDGVDALNAEDVAVETDLYVQGEVL